MRWGPYGSPLHRSRKEETGLVYFGGATKSGTILGLGGSMYHCIGELRQEDYVHSVSASYAIISKLTK